MAAWRLFCSVVAVGVVLTLSGLLSPPTNARVAKSGTVIACFHKEIDRYSAQAHPSECNIGGYRDRGREFVEVPVRGVSWGHWGFNPTRGAYGHEKATGKAIRLIAYRPIPCGEGLIWYSRIVIFFPAEGRGFELRLPACGDSAAPG